MVLHSSDPANPYKKKETPDTQTQKSPPSAVLANPVKKMIPTPPKANQTAIAILITINHHFFGFSLANCWSMAGMIGHIGTNEQTCGGEHFRYFTNLTSTSQNKNRELKKRLFSVPYYHLRGFLYPLF
jgi:hypothetical protein